jgi:putative copper resistance protein D
LRSLYLVSVFLHVVAACVWIGGMVALAAVVVPVLRRDDMRETAMEFMREAGLRLRTIGWVVLPLLVVTGLFQVTHRAGGVSPLLDGAFWASPWGRLVGLKLLIVATVMGLEAWHDWWVGPRATEVGRTAPGSPEALQLRRRASWIGRTNLLLSLAALGLGVLLVRGGV